MVPEKKKRKITRNKSKKGSDVVHPVPSLSIRATEWRWRMDAICRCTMDELKQVIADKETDAADLMLSQIVVHAIKMGDHKRLEFILERTIGKVKETLEVTQPKPTVIRRRNGDEIELGTLIEESKE